jgi:hypothetical protein
MDRHGSAGVAATIGRALIGTVPSGCAAGSTSSPGPSSVPHSASPPTPTAVPVEPASATPLVSTATTPGCQPDLVGDVGRRTGDPGCQFGGRRRGHRDLSSGRAQPRVEPRGGGVRRRALRRDGPVGWTLGIESDRGNESVQLGRSPMVITTTNVRPGDAEVSCADTSLPATHRARRCASRIRPGCTGPSRPGRHSRVRERQRRLRAQRQGEAAIPSRSRGPSPAASGRGTWSNGAAIRRNGGRSGSSGPAR